MKMLFKISSALAICALLGSALTLAGQDAGTVVSDDVASRLFGGCAGVGTNVCGGVNLPCPQTAVGNGSDSDNDPNTITAYWCAVTVNGERVCNTCSANYVSCSSE